MCNILTFENVDFDGWCGLMRHYRTTGVPSELVIDPRDPLDAPDWLQAEFIERQKQFANKINAARRQKFEPDATFDIDVYHFQWYAAVSVVAVYERSNGALRLRFLKSANKSINAIG